MYKKSDPNFLVGCWGPCGRRLKRGLAGDNRVQGAGIVAFDPIAVRLEPFPDVLLGEGQATDMGFVDRTQLIVYRITGIADHEFDQATLSHVDGHLVVFGRLPVHPVIDADDPVRLLGVDRPADAQPVVVVNPRRTLEEFTTAGIQASTNEHDLLVVTRQDYVSDRVRHLDGPAGENLETDTTPTGVAKNPPRCTILDQDISLRGIPVDHPGDDRELIEINGHNSSKQSPDNLVKVVISISSF